MAVVIIACLGVWIATAGVSESSEQVGDAAASSELATQSFDDITALIPGDQGTTELAPTEPGSIIQTPGDVPLPGLETATEFGAVEEPLSPSAVTVTETAPVGDISDPVVVETVTQAPTETETPTATVSTVTETAPAPAWPNVALSGSISVPPVTIPQRTDPPQTVVVQPSTVTVLVPAPTTTPRPPTSTTARPTTSRPDSCRASTATPKSGASSSTTPRPSPTQTTRTATPTTSKKPAPTTMGRPCR